MIRGKREKERGWRRNDKRRKKEERRGNGSMVRGKRRRKRVMEVWWGEREEEEGRGVRVRDSTSVNFLGSCWPCHTPPFDQLSTTFVGPFISDAASHYPRRPLESRGYHSTHTAVHSKRKEEKIDKNDTLLIITWNSKQTSWILVTVTAQLLHQQSVENQPFITHNEKKK